MPEYYKLTYAECINLNRRITKLESRVKQLESWKVCLEMQLDQMQAALNQLAREHGIEVLDHSFVEISSTGRGEANDNPKVILQVLMEPELIGIARENGKKLGLSFDEYLSQAINSLQKTMS